MTDPLTAHCRALELVEKATGPDREIDYQVCMIADSGDDPIPSYCYPTPFTASLDAVIALVEREMPDANWEVKRIGGAWHPGFDHCARVARPYSGKGDHEDGKPSADARHKTSAALALLAAFLRARIAELEQEAVG